MKDTLQEIFVSSGEVKACKGEGILQSSAIGSCVVVAAYDPDSAVGGMAHVMLPGGTSDPNPLVKTKYAKDAVEEMMRAMSYLGAMEARVHICLVGGANVLGDGHDSPGPDTVRSLTEILGGRGITPVAMEVGDTQRRSCVLHVACGLVTYTVGDSEQRTLWEAKACGIGPHDGGCRSSPDGEKGVKA
jgi:chemotaxis protein CheD